MKNSENELLDISNDILKIKVDAIKNSKIGHNPEVFKKDLLTGDFGKNECILLCFSDHTDLAGCQIQLD